MMQPQPMIALADVRAGSKWFQAVLGVRSGHDTENAVASTATVRPSTRC